MTTIVLTLFVLAVNGWSLALAHDIGISKATLMEHENHQYRLGVQTGPSGSHLFGTPVLPIKCEYPKNPRGTQGMSWRYFEFVCNSALSGKDTLLLPWRRDGVMITAEWQDGSGAKRLFLREGAQVPVPLSKLQAGSGSWLDAAKRYISIGIEHILWGIDHLLFVLALLVIVRGPWMLLKTITAFTIAHSMTLALATLDFITVPSRPVEAAIALSIVFLCVEIIHARRGQVSLTYRYPWLVAFAFGLLHGFGFAGALAEIGLPHSEIPQALLFFNIGVEIGQLVFVGVVVAGALTFVYPLRNLMPTAQPWVHSSFVYTIGTIATYWFIQRMAIIILSPS